MVVALCIRLCTAQRLGVSRRYRASRYLNGISLHIYGAIHDNNSTLLRIHDKFVMVKGGKKPDSRSKELAILKLVIIRHGYVHTMGTNYVKEAVDREMYFRRGESYLFICMEK